MWIIHQHWRCVASKHFTCVENIESLNLHLNVPSMRPTKVCFHWTLQKIHMMWGTEKNIKLTRHILKHIRSQPSLSYKTNLTHTIQKTRRQEGGLPGRCEGKTFTVIISTNDNLYPNRLKCIWFFNKNSIIKKLLWT